MKYEKGTFIVVPNRQVLRGQPAELQSIFMWLCDHADANGECFPSRSTLADEAGVGIRTLDKYLSKMEELGIIKKTARTIDGKSEQTTNLYEIMLIGGRSICATQREICATPSVKNDTRTIPSINQTHLTSEFPAGNSGSDQEGEPQPESAASSEFHGETTVRWDVDSDGNPVPPKERKQRSQASLVFAVFESEGIVSKTPALWTKSPAFKEAADRLLKERGLEQVQNALRHYKRLKGESYCPQITSPFDLDAKWLKLLAFVRKQNQ